MISLALAASSWKSSAMHEGGPCAWRSFANHHGIAKLGYMIQASRTIKPGDVLVKMSS